MWTRLAENNDVYYWSGCVIIYEGRSLLITVNVYKFQELDVPSLACLVAVGLMDVPSAVHASGSLRDDCKQDGCVACDMYVRGINDVCKREEQDELCMPTYAWLAAAKRQQPGLAAIAPLHTRFRLHI